MTKWMRATRDRLVVTKGYNGKMTEKTTIRQIGKGKDVTIPT